MRIRIRYADWWDGSTDREVEGRGSGRRMDLGIVSVGDLRRVEVPVPRVVVDVFSQCRREGAVVSFGLAVCLGVVCRCVKVVDSQHLAYILEELGGEIWAVIG